MCKCRRWFDCTALNYSKKVLSDSVVLLGCFFMPFLNSTGICDFEIGIKTGLYLKY